MNSFVFVIILLPLSLANAVNFTQVFEWPHGLDYEWPSEANRTRALKDGTFKPEHIYPLFMAVYARRIFLSLHDYYNTPVSLVSLPTSSAASASPKLTPVPSWDMHGKSDCNKIQAARGLEVDSIGRLWVLDNGLYKCNAKLWTIDLVNIDHTELIHRYSFNVWMHDLVLDETPNETLAYISRRVEQHFVVFSLERNQSWIVDTPGIEGYPIALSPKEEPRQLYLGKRHSNELYSISVSALRNGTRTANLQLVGRWTEKHDSYRMLMNNHGTIYTAFRWRHYLSSYNTSQPFREQRFHDVGELETPWPFSFALDSSGNFWMTECNDTFLTKPKFRLLKAAVGAKSYMSEPPKTGKRQTDNSALIGSLTFLLVLSFIINLWFTLRMRNSNNCNEQRNAGAEEMELPTAPNHVSTEMVDEESFL